MSLNLPIEKASVGCQLVRGAVWSLSPSTQFPPSKSMPCQTQSSQCLMLSRRPT